MRGVSKWLVVTTGMAALAGCAAQPGVSGSQFSGLQSKDALAKVGWQYYWSMPRPSFFEADENVQSLYMLNDAIICQTDHNRVISYEAATGAVRWSRVVAPRDQRVFEPAFVKDMSLHEAVPGLKGIVEPDSAPMARLFDAVVVSTPFYVLVLDARTGRVVRDEAVGKYKDVSSYAAGCADAKRYYGVTSKGLCFAIDLDSGIRLWSFGGYSGIVTPVRAFAGQIFTGNQDGEVIVAQADKARAVNWMKQIPEPIVAPFSVSKRGLIIAGERGGLYAFQAIGGKNMWEGPFRCEGRLVDPVQVSGRSVFQRVEGGLFYAVSLTNGKQRWTMKDGRLVLAVVGEDAFVLDARRVLHVVNEETGKPKWALPLTGLDVFLPGTGSDGIWAAASDGRVVCLRPLTAGRLTLDKLNAP